MTTSSGPVVFEDRAQAMVYLIKRLPVGAVGILPTDTLYGISGDCRSHAVVDRINRIKERSGPATIIPHDTAWAATLVAPRFADKVAQLLTEHMGETLLFPKGPGADVLPPSLTESGLIGLRLPLHWAASVTGRAKVPVITTSVNRHGHPPMTSLEDLDPKLRAQLDFIMYEGPLLGPASPQMFFDVDPPRRVVRS